MPRVILAELDDPPVAADLLRAAVRLAELTGGATVHALIVRTPPIATILPTEEVLTEERANQIRAQEGARAESIARAFRDWVRDTASSAQLSDVEANAAEIVAERGKLADFLVIGRPVRRTHGTGSAALHAALFATDRPVLVVPPASGDRFGRRIALAWREDNRTIRAVLAAMRCFAALEHLFVLAGHRKGQPPPRLPDILAEHSVPAELRILEIGQRPFGEIILEAAHACGADLLVLGAFAHDPLRRLILGGVTEHMLAHADLPLLMRH
jgi:nucleotide-binding universal stress UspA family protein